MNSLKFALRQFRKNPGFSAVAVLTLALGLGLVAAVFTLFNAVFLRVDAVERPGELYALKRTTRPGADSPLPFTRAEYEALRRETDVFTDVSVQIGNIETRIQGRPVSASFVTPNFFEMLGVTAARGRPLGSADVHATSGRVLVLSDRGWRKLTGSDPAAVGRFLTVNGLTCEVVGVMPATFRGLRISAPDYWAPVALASEFRPTYAGREGEMPVSSVVGRLKPGVTPEQGAAALQLWASGRVQGRAPGDQPGPITLKHEQGTLPIEFVAAFAPLFFAFSLVLLIGCANVANLLLARSLSRQREVGMRLALGASRSRLIRQLLTESFLLALVSAVGAILVSRLFLKGALYGIVTTMPAEVAEQMDLEVPSADWRLLVFLFAGALVATVAFGLLPALQATRVELVRAIRGEVTGSAPPRRGRHILIGAQVCASTLLLICSTIFLRSAFAAASKDPGIRTSDTLSVPIANEPTRAAILREIRTHPLVVSVAAASPRVQAEASVSTELISDQLNGALTNTTRTLPIEYKFVSPEYFELLGIKLNSGRGFETSEQGAEAGVAVISESAAKRLWPDGNAVGRLLQLRSNPAELQQSSPLNSPLRTYTVVGVARDVGGDTMFQSFSYSGLYLPTHPQAAGMTLTLRVRGDPERARIALLDRLTQIDPALDHEIRTMRTVAGLGVYILRLAFGATLFLGALALTLTVSGLFGVLSYLVVQSSREIGVRLALGATSRMIARLILLQSLRPVGMGLLAGGGLACAVAVILVSTPFAAEIARTILILDPVAYAASALVIVAASLLASLVPAWRAARLDPIATLRQD